MTGCGFGACFVVYAAAIAKIYGSRLFTSLYPICFLSYGFAGITGPFIGGWLADLLNSFTPGVVVSILIIIIAVMAICRLMPGQYDLAKSL